jgi:hypothetical protein
MESVFAIPRQQLNIRQSFKVFLNDFVWHLHFHFIPHHTNNYHPHIFSHRMTGLLAGLLLSVKIFSLTALTFSPAIPAWSSAITQENIINLTNATRKSFSLNELTENSILTKAAQAKANDMAEKGYFSHTSPDGKLPWDFMKQAGYEYIMAGENLAVNFLESEAVNTAWMNSPTHKANLLNKNYEQIGIGIAQGNYGNRESMFVVQMFGVPTEQTIALSKEATKIAEPVPAPLVASSSVSIENLDVNILGNEVIIRAQLSPSAVKALAVYGKKAVRLYPKGNNIWQAVVPIASVSSINEQMVLRVYDLAGKKTEKAVAIFAKDLASNFQIISSESVAGKTISAFGKTVNIKDFEYKFYLLFVTGVLSCLILAIGIKRHIQHISLVANGSFVVILAMLLWGG